MQFSEGEYEIITSILVPQNVPEISLQGFQLMANSQRLETLVKASVMVFATVILSVILSLLTLRTGGGGGDARRKLPHNLSDPVPNLEHWCLIIQC